MVEIPKPSKQTINTLTKWAKQLGIKPKEMFTIYGQKYQEFVEKHQNNARIQELPWLELKVRGKVYTDEVKRRSGSGKWFVGYILGESDPYNRYERHWKDAKKLFDKNPQRCIEGIRDTNGNITLMTNENGEPLDFRETVMGQANPNRWKQILPRYGFVKNFIAVANPTDSPDEESVFLLIAWDDRANPQHQGYVTCENLFIQKYKWKALISPENRQNSDEYVNATITSKFEPIESKEDLDTEVIIRNNFKVRKLQDLDNFVPDNENEPVVVEAMIGDYGDNHIMLVDPEIGFRKPEEPNANGYRCWLNTKAGFNAGNDSEVLVIGNARMKNKFMGGATVSGVKEVQMTVWGIWVTFREERITPEALSEKDFTHFQPVEDEGFELTGKPEETTEDSEGFWE